MGGRQRRALGRNRRGAHDLWFKSIAGARIRRGDPRIGAQATQGVFATNLVPQLPPVIMLSYSTWGLSLKQRRMANAKNRFVT